MCSYTKLITNGLQMVGAHTLNYYHFWTFYFLAVTFYIYLLLRTEQPILNIRDTSSTKTLQSLYINAFHSLKDSSKIYSNLSNTTIHIHPTVVMETYVSGIGTKIFSHIPNNTALFTFSKDWTISPYMDHKFGIIIQKALNDCQISLMTALISNFFYEIYKLPNSYIHSLIPCLPSISWTKNNGIFSISEERYNKTARGTTIELKQMEALNETYNALLFLNSLQIHYHFHHLFDPTEIQWAYLILKSFGFYHEAECKKFLIFPMPLIFLRRTYKSDHTSNIRFDNERNIYLLEARDSLDSDTELTIYDECLTVGSVFLYRGLWISGDAPIKIPLTLSFQPPDLYATILHSFLNISPDSLISLYKGNSINYSLLSPLRLIAHLSRYPNQKGFLNANWFDTWPYTLSLNRIEEIHATNWILDMLHSRINNILETNYNLKAEFSNDDLAYHPIIQIRQAELNILNDNLKVFNSLLVFLQDPDLYLLFCKHEASQINRIKI